MLELGLDQFWTVTYVEGNTNGKNYVDMQLMSMCKGMVMSNSAFCYLKMLCFSIRSDHFRTVKNIFPRTILRNPIYKAVKL